MQAKTKGKSPRSARIITRLWLALLTFLPCARALAEGNSCPPHLFVIERSKNKNIVAYDAKRGPAGDLESGNPVVVYWLLNGDKDKRKQVTHTEQQSAYVVGGQPGGKPGTLSMVFKAQPKRQFNVRMLNG